VNVTVVDSAGWRLWTPGVTEVVVPGPEVTLASSASEIDLGGTVDFTGTETGGVTPITFAWFLNSTLQSPTTTYWNFTPKGAAIYGITFQATDADQATVTSTTTLTVYADPIVSTPSASPPSVDWSQSTTISATASYGSGGFSYAWSGLPPGCTGTTASITCTPEVNGTYHISVKITDSNGYSATSGALQFIVYPDPVVTVPVANRSSADVGQAVWFNVTLTIAGSGGDAYWWGGLPGGCTNSSTPTLGPCSPTSSGTFTVSIKVRDSNGFVASGGSLSYKVHPDPTISTPTANPTEVDVGQMTNFSTTAGGGWGGLTLTWFNLPTGCLSSNLSMLPCTSTGSGTFNVGVGVKDGNGMWVQSSTISFTVYSDPTSGTPSFLPSTVDLGQVTLASTSTSGGYGPFTYAWIGLPAGCSAVVASFSCKPTVTGSFSVTVRVKDANGMSATSLAAVLTINADPLASQSPATQQTNESGQANRFTVNVTLGTAPYTYQWLVNGTAVTGATSSVFIFHPVYPANYTINVTVIDKAGWQLWTAGVVETVLPGPHVSFTAPTQSTDVGRSVTFTGTESGGVSPFAFAWFLNSTIMQNGPSLLWTFKPTGAATYHITLRVTDSNQAYINSTTLIFTVYADPVVSSLAASPASVDLGQQTTFTTVASFGSGGFSYAWSGLPSGCSSSASSFSCSPGITGTFTVSVTVTDSIGVSAVSSPLSFTVFVDPTITTPTVNRTSADVGQSISFTSTTSGGSGGNTYAWAGLPTGCTSSNSLTVYCTPGVSGTFEVKVTVTDSNGFSVTSPAASITIHSAPVVTGPKATPASIDIGQSATFSVMASSGSGGFSYAWSGLPTGCLSANSYNITCAPSIAGSYNITVRVTDSNGYSVTGTTLFFMVHSIPTVTLSANVTFVDLGRGIELTLTIYGGLGPYTAAWTLNGSAWALPPGGDSSFLFIPSGAGTFIFSAMVTDSLGGTSYSSAPVTVTVNARLAVSVVESPSSIALGATALFNGTVHGGTAPFTYQWYVDGTASSGATGIQFSFTPSSSGTYDVTLVVTDAAGIHVTSVPFVLTVTSPKQQNQNTGSFLSGPFLWILIVIIVAALVVIIVLMRRRHRPEEARPPTETEAAQGLVAAAAFEGGPSPEESPLPLAEPEPFQPESTPEPYVPEEFPSELPQEIPAVAVVEAPTEQPTPTMPPEEPKDAPIAETPPPAPPAPPPEPVKATEPVAPPAPSESSDNLFDTILLSAGLEVPAEQAAAAQKKPSKKKKNVADAAPAAAVAAPAAVPPKPAKSPTCPRCGEALPSADSECLACALDRLNESIDAPPGHAPSPGTKAPSTPTELPKVCLFCKKPLDAKGYCDSCNINWEAINNV
jgi:hypothetical protein